MDNRSDRSVLENKWKIFMTACSNCEDAQEKEEALDDYLSYFISAISDIDITADRQCSANFATAGILSRWLIDDIARLGEEANGGSPQCSLNYLYTGRGFRLFRVLEEIGVHAISCNFELAKLLLSLLAFMKSQPLVKAATCTEMAEDEDGSNSVEQLDNLENIVKVNEVEMGLPNALDSIFKLLKQMCSADIQDCSSTSTPLKNVAFTVLIAITGELKTLLDDEIYSNVKVPYSYIMQQMISLVFNIGKALLKHQDPLYRFPLISQSLIEFINARLKKLEESHSHFYNPMILNEILSCNMGIVDLLLTASDSLNYTAFMDLFHLFFDDSVCNILTKSALFLFQSTSSHQKELIKFIEMLGQLGLNARNLQYGPRDRKDRNVSKRWRCDISSHHNPAFNNDKPCVVGIVTRLLVSLINRVPKDEVLAGAILKALAKSGHCCCHALRDIIIELFTSFTCLSANLQKLRLHVIETTVISMSGFQVLSARSMIECVSCKNRMIANDKILRDVLHEECAEMATSKYIECLQLNEKFVNGYWSVFDLFNRLLQSATPQSVVLMLETHFQSLFNDISITTVKLELFLRVILPNLLRYSDDKSHDDGILKSMLNVTLSIASIPEVNRLLHMVNVMKRLYHKLISLNLRYPLLKLLNIMSSSSWVAHLNGVSPYIDDNDDSNDCYLNLEEMNEILNDFYDTLLNYSCDYRNIVQIRLKDQEVITRKDCTSTVNNESMLECITDMWRTMSLITDRFTERREWFYNKPFRGIVYDFTLELARNRWANVCVTSGSKREWELLGILIHIISTCQNNENPVSSGRKIEEEVESIFILQDDTDYLSIANILFCTLAMASLEGHDDFDHSKVDDGKSEREKVSAKISCPSVLNLLLKLVLKYKAWIYACNEREKQSKYWLPIYDVLRNITWFCQTNSENSEILLKDCQMSLFILKDFYDVLTLPGNEAFLQLQNVVFELFASSVKDNMMDWELKSYLKLFIQNPSLSSELLNHLNLIFNAFKTEPSHLLTFLSVESTLLSSATPGSTGRTFSGGDQDEETTAPLDPNAQTFLRTIKHHRTNEKMYSSLAVASVGMLFPQLQLHRNDDLPFGGSEGLGVSIWFMIPDHSNMRIQPRTIHLFTFDYEKLAFEVWIHLDSKLLLFKLSSWTSDSYEILDTKITNKPLELNDWQHLLINWVPYRKAKKLTFKITCYSNGMYYDASSVNLECDKYHLLTSRAKQLGLLIGHSSVLEKRKAIWHLGHLRLFRGPFDNDAAGLLYKLVGNTQLEILQIGLVDPIFKPPDIDESDTGLNNLKSQLLATYLPQNPSIVIWHANGNKCGEYHINTFKIGSYQSQVSSRSLHVTLTRIGGAVVFISLFGLVSVNFPLHENVQTSCLKLLLNLIRRDEKMKRHFVDCAGWDLIFYAISAAKCKISCKMMSILLQELISTPEEVLEFNSFEKWFINKTAITNATITDPYLLSLLLSNWKMWNDGNKETLKFLLRCCQYLIDLENTKRDYNLKVFTEINVLDIIIEILRDRWLGKCSTLSKGCSRSVVRLLEILCGGRPECLPKLLDCLIVIHPFDNSVVHHARAAFYFMPEMLSRTSSIISPQSSLSSKPDLSKENYLSVKNIATESDLIANSEQIDLVVYPTEVPVSIPMNSVTNGNEYDRPNLTDSDSEESQRTAPSSLNGDKSNLDSYSSGSSTSAKSLNELTAMKRIATLPSVSDSQQRTIDANDLSQYIDIGIISTGIIALLGNIICEADDLTFSEISKIIDSELLVVFALHPVESVRAEVVKTLKSYFFKLTRERKLKKKKQNICIALSNQLFQYKASALLAEACIEFIIGEKIKLHTCDQVLLTNFRVVESNAMILAMSLLPRLCHDVKSCESFIDYLDHICKFHSNMYFFMFDFGLVQSICLAISAVVSNYCKSVDKEGTWESDHLLNKLNNFLTDACYCFLWFLQGKKFSRYTETLAIIEYYESLELQRNGFDSVSYLALRNCHSSCLITGLVTLYYYDWHDYATAHDSCCYESFISNVMSRSYILPSKLPSDEDLQDHMGKVLCYTVSHVTNFGVKFTYANMSAMEKWLCQYTMHIIGEGMAILYDCENVRRSFANALGPCWHHHFFQFISFVFIPQQPISFLVNIAQHITKCHPTIKGFLLFLNDDFKCRKQVIDCLETVLREPDDESSSEKDINVLKKLILEIKVGVVSTSVNKILNDGKWVCIAPENKRLIHKLENRCKEVVKFANQAATLTESHLTKQRKIYHTTLEKSFSARLYIRQKWQSLVTRLTHERAIWYHPESFPLSWQLDSTEGPHRVRKRLSRCSLVMSERFLLPHAVNKLEVSRNVHPFERLFEDEDMQGDRAFLYDDIQTKKKILFASNCSMITPATEISGEMLVGSNCLYYVGGEKSKNRIKQSEDNYKTFVTCHRWKYREIKEIHKRRYELQDNAMELFLTNGQTHLLAFDTSQDRDLVYNRLMTSDLPNLIPEIESFDVHTKMWREGAITNFEYLTQLNKFGGRTFNDLMQYPVFPYILSDYLRPILDLNNPSSFRNLAKPIAIQVQEREVHYHDQYLHTKELFENSRDPTILGPYNYSSLYSNSGIVLHFIVRLPPFTNMFLNYQGNSFDVPDRTFHSMHTTWRLSSSDSTSDVKELIPEFFFLPEMFLNSEGFNFGIRQNGELVDNVKLPQWCRGDPRLFTLIHRQALETHYVTENLQNWIDLVFGYKQTGKAAVEAINVFHPVMYYGFYTNQINDANDTSSTNDTNHVNVSNQARKSKDSKVESKEVARKALKTMLQTYGQSPVQLFRRPHPLVSLSLTPRSQSSSIKKVMEEVIGLRWGNYVGSPSESSPKEIHRKLHSKTIGSFVSLVTNEVFGLAPKTALLVQYCKDKGVSVINTTYVKNAGLLHWGGHDGLIRIQLRRESQFQAFAAMDMADMVTCCATAPDWPYIFFGKSSGNIVVYHYLFDSTPENTASSITLKWNKITHLYGHDTKVTAIHICKDFSIAVSASADATCIIWDLNQLMYIRSIKDHQDKVTLVSVSETSGDIASVSNLADGGSVLMLHTINAKHVGQIKSKKSITSICFSCAPEGSSVNVICAGLQNGAILMWNTWDLSLVRSIKLLDYNSAISSMMYSFDCQHLYISNQDGIMIILESSNSDVIPKFRTII